MNSRQKGKRSELEVAAILRDLGFELSRRSAQHCGRPAAAGAAGTPDVLGIEGVHIEVKNRTTYGRAALQAWLERNTEDAGPNVPIVIHKSNRIPWMATVWLGDIVRLAAALAGAVMERDLLELEIDLDDEEAT